jgi:hypothetical protein
MTLANAIAFLSRNLPRILSGCAIVVVIALVATCHYASKVNEALDTNPPLPKKEVARIVAKQQAAEKAAAVYQQVAKVKVREADSLHRVVLSNVKQADSLRHESQALPASTAGPLSRIQRTLANYQSPDTAR